MIKKFSSYVALLAVCLGFASCEDAKDPVFQQPASPLSVEAPDYSERTLAPGQTTSIGTAVRPDYGFTAAVNYSAEVSLDKQKSIALNLTSPTEDALTVKDDELAMAMNKLNGIKNDADWAANTAAQQPQTIYVRATCEIPGVAASIVSSEWIAINNVKPYAAVPQVPRIYLIGDISSWSEPKADNADKLLPLFDNDETGVYVAEAVVNQAEFNFRFVMKFATDPGNAWGTATFLGCPEGNN